MKSRVTIRMLAAMAVIGAAFAVNAQAGDRSWHGNGQWAHDTRGSRGYSHGDWNRGRHDWRGSSPYAYRGHRGYGYGYHRYPEYPRYYRWHRAPNYVYGPRYYSPYDYSPGYYAPPSWGVWLDVPGLVLQFQVP